MSRVGVAVCEATQVLKCPQLAWFHASASRANAQRRVYAIHPCVSTTYLTLCIHKPIPWFLGPDREQPIPITAHRSAVEMGEQWSC